MCMARPEPNTEFGMGPSGSCRRLWCLSLILGQTARRVDFFAGLSGYSNFCVSYGYRRSGGSPGKIGVRSGNMDVRVRVQSMNFLSRKKSEKWLRRALQRWHRAFSALKGATRTFLQRCCLGWTRESLDLSDGIKKTKTLKPRSSKTCGTISASRRSSPHMTMGSIDQCSRF